VAGVAAVREVLAGLGLDVSAVQTVDGSGLDRANRTTCAALVAVAGVRQRPALSDLDGALPAAGEGIRAKRGYLEDVTGMAGTVDRTGLTFAFLLNGGVPEPAGPDLARFAAVLGGYESPVPLADSVVLAPAPG
jgi:D-alanyl-D-alanine carboxypeptidase